MLTLLLIYYRPIAEENYRVLHRALYNPRKNGKKGLYARCAGRGFRGRELVRYLNFFRLHSPMIEALWTSFFRRRTTCVPQHTVAFWSALLLQLRSMHQICESKFRSAMKSRQLKHSRLLSQVPLKLSYNHSTPYLGGAHPRLSKKYIAFEDTCVILFGLELSLVKFMTRSTMKRWLNQRVSNCCKNLCTVDVGVADPGSGCGSRIAIGLVTLSHSVFL